MGIVKTAYQLASERIIVSNFAKEIRREKEREAKIEKERLEELPDFVREWEESLKAPDEKISNVIEDVEKNPTRLIRKGDNPQQENIEIENDLDTGDIMVQESEVIHFDNSPNIHWYGHFSSYSGFSRMNRAMVFGLANRNVNIKLDIQPCAIEINESTQRQLKMMENAQVKPNSPKIFGATIPLQMSHAGKKILYTMMENEETLHREYVERLNLFDEIWVPTRFGERIFKKNGVTRPIYVMPLGVETNRYSSDVSPYPFQMDLADFRFISVFKWGYRKGYDILLKAYLEEFSSSDNVSLLLISRNGIDPNPNKIAEDFKAIRMGIDKKDEDLPHIALYDKPIPEKDMPRVYNAAQAFCLISRGEGFGLPYYEAGACGLPVISSNCSGQTDLLTEENSFLVEPDDHVIAKINGPLSKLAKHCRFYENQMFPDFGPTAIMKTREHMRYVFENYSKAKKKAAILEKYIKNNCSWDIAVDRVLERIKQIV